MLKLSHIKFPAVGNEAANLLAVAPEFGVDVHVTRSQGWFKRTYVQLDATSDRGMLYIGSFYTELRKLGRA